MAGYDLHVHSSWSDGKNSVLKLAHIAKEASLDGFALSDHDTIDGWAEIDDAMAATGITIFPSLEISTEWHNRDVHILVFGLLAGDKALLDMLELLAESRRERVHIMVERLGQLGFPVDVDKVFERVGNGVPGRPHIGRELIEKGYAASMQEVFDKFIGRGCPAYSPRAKLLPWDAVDMVVKAGGSAVLAHPGLDDALEALPYLLDAGLEGIEVYHPRHDQKKERELLDLAKKKGLYVTAGSDYHGFSDRGHGAMGVKRLPPKRLPAILRRGE